MTLFRRKNAISLCGFFLALAVSACSTVKVRDGRQGLLDQRPGKSHEKGEFSRRISPETVTPDLFGDVNLIGRWQWPLRNVEISSQYGERGRRFHQGIDLRAPIGTPVEAASDGEVVYVGSKIRGYGRMVVLKHGDGYYTVYAHHSKNRVNLNQKVKAGQVIALSGKSGHASGPHLHFELRRGARSIDPEYALNRYFKTAANRRIASRSRNESH